MTAPLTFLQLQDLFYGVTVTMTGLSTTQVRQAYQQQGQPAWEVTQNIAFINITEKDDPFNKQRDIIYSKQDTSNAVQNAFYTRVMQVQWSLYGPNSFDLVDTIRYQILTDPIRSTLSTSQVYPIPSIQAPTRLPEQRNGQWWERSDITVLFNVATLHTSTVPYLTAAEVVMETSNGTTTDINISHL